MPSFADFRSRFPSLQDASDEEIIKRTSEVFKLPITEVAQSFDYDISGGKTSQRFGSAIDRYQAGLYGTAEAVTKAAGLEGTSDYLQKQRVRNEAQADISSARAKELGAIESYKDVTGVGTGIDYVTGLAIGSAPYMAEALVTGGAGRLAMTGTRAALAEGRTALAAAEAAKDVAAADKAKQAIAVAERNLRTGATAAGFAGQYPSGVGEMLSQQREQTGGQTDLPSALGYGAAYTGLGMVGVEGALTRGNLFRNTINFLDKPGGLSGAALRTGATAVSTGLKEGVSETLQEGAGQGARMAVDDKAQFFDQDAIERYKESFVGGAALGGVMGGSLGGWRRSNSILPGATQDTTKPQAPANNAIQQAFDQPQTSGMPTTNVVPPPAPPITPSADTTPPPAPIVSGGTTPIAQATQQQSQADAAAQQQQQQQAQRDLTISQFGLAGDTPGVGSFFGRPIFGSAINQVADALAPIAAQLNPAEAAIMDAIVTADQKLGNKLLSFQFNADKIANSVQKGVQAVTTAATKFQIADVQTVDEAATRLNTLSKSAKGQQLEQINAIHEALTGKDTEGYIASQTSKSKGKSNVQQQQQVSSGVGTVPVQGGTIQGDGGLTGLLQPGAVQPVGAGVVSGAADDQQAGQLPGEGIRTGPSVTAADDLGGAAQTPQVTAPAPDTNQLLRQVFGGNYAIDESVPPATISGPVRVPGSGGAVRVQPQQTPSAGVPGAVSESVGGERVVRRKKRVVTPAAATPTGMQFYSSAIEHIHPTKRSEIVLALLVQALETQGKVGGGDNQLSAITRAQIVQLSLMEQMTAQEIAIALATSDTPVDVKPDTIQKQRTRLGIKEDEFGGLAVDTNSDVGKKFLSSFVEAAANFKTDAFPDGIGPDQLRGFYAAKNTFNDNGTVVELGELVEESASRTTEVKLQEELYRTKAEGGDTQAMGEVTPGGSQGNVDSTKKTQVNKKTKARVLDVGALDQITDLEAEADKLRDALEEMAPKDPRREGLLARLEAIGDIDTGEIAALWSQYNQAQQIRSKEAEAAGVEKKEEAETTPEELTGDELAASEREDERKAEAAEKAAADQGETNAVQEPSAEKVSVSEGAAGGQAVGKGVGKVGKATRVRKAKVEKPVEAKVEEVTPAVLTPKEQWDALTQQFPGMPPYDVLTKSEKETWDDFANRGFGDIGSVATVLGGADKIAKASEAVTETAVEATPPAAEPGILASRGTFLDFEDIETQLSGVDLVREQLREAGIENALDFVSDWTLESDTSKDAWHGSLEVVGGRYVGSLNTAKLNNPKYAALVARHEISHAADMAPHGGIYSAQPEMGVAVQNGQVVPTGNVAREMFALYQTDADWKDFLAYPFDIDQYPDLDNGTKIQIELFAQIMAVYTSPAGRAYIEAAAPRTAAYLKEVVNDIRSSKPLQIQKAEVAALRTISFQNRNQPSRNKTTGGLPPKDRVREEIGPLAAKGAAATVDAAVNLLPPKLRSPVRNTTTDLLYQAKKGMLASAITEDVINMASKFMKSAKTYLAAQYARQATRLNHELKIEKILNQFDKLPKNLQGTGEGSVNKYIFDSTREGKWGYIPDERMVGTTLLTVDPDMAKRYDAFPDSAKKLIRDVFEQGYDALEAKQNAVRDAVDREYADRLKAVQGDVELTNKLNKEKKLALSRERKLLGLDNSKPYAYLGRYGDYVVVGKSAEYKFHEEQVKAGPVVKGEDLMGARSAAWLDENRTNPAHYVVQFAETLGEANQIADQLNATGNYDIAESYEKEPYSQEGGDLFLAVARLRTLFDKEAEGANPAAQASIRSLLGDLYLHTVSEASSRKSEFQRLNISGADQDMMRNLATRGRADAHFLAALEHNDAISDAITAMREERNRNRGEAGPYFNELLKRHANSMKYETPGVLSSALLRMSNVWYLATNPAFYLQQILQTGVLSLPYMSGRLGYFRSARAVKKAYGDMSALVKGLGVDDHIDFSKAPADVREMLTKLVGMGKIDIGIDSDARVRAGEAGVAAKVMQKLQGVNNRIEAVNRATAAIAAYRGYLDRYKNGDTVAATAYAADVVSNTHGSYDAFNTPRIMQTGAGKVLLQFKRFQIIQISMLLKLINTAFKGASRDEKAVARRALGFIAGHMMVLGGALAVPFVTQFGSLLLKAFGDDDEPENLELALRRLINDPVMADLLINGVPGALGVNLGGKLGMGNTFSILPFTDIDFASRAGAEKMLVGIMGPSAGLGLKFADGLGQIASGEYYKGLEAMLPSGVANVMKAGRFATEGITMRNGDVVLKPEEISMFDAAFQAVGLPTTTITDRQFTQRVVAEFDKFYDKRITEIKGDYVEASRSGDVNGMADAREEWSKLQESRAKNGYKRQPLSDLFRAPSAAAKRERNIAGGVEFSKSNRQFVESLSTL